MWPFNFSLFGPTPIWKGTGREFLRQETYITNRPYVEVEFFNAYAVHYKDLRSGQTNRRKVGTRMKFTSEQEAVDFLETRGFDVTPDLEILLAVYQQPHSSVEDTINYLIEEHDYQITYV